MRDELLNGRLDYPGAKLLEAYPGKEEEIHKFWKAIWLNFLNDTSTNGIHWYERLGIKLYNDMIRRLSHHGWVTSSAVSSRKWADVEINTDKLYEFVSPDELQSIKAKYKYTKYTLDRTEAKASRLVRQNNKTKRTGLVRTGFRDAGNTQFGYDMAALNKYEQAVKLNLTKAMDKVRIDYPEMKSTTSSYDTVSVGIYDYHFDNQLETYTTGENINDSRGRAISQCLKKVANPISSKDFRAALVITYED